MRIFVSLCLYLTAISIQGQTVEAESGTLSGTQVSTQHAGYTGTGFVTGFDSDGDKVTMTVNVIKGDLYNLYIRYAAPFGEKYNFVYVNNVNFGSVQFTASNGFKETLVGKIFLDKGVNT